MKILELFAGIGACSTALKRMGMDLEIVDAVEIDKFAIASFNAIHNTNFEKQDITEWNKQLKDIDLITHGSPCQDFSVAGKQAGGDLGSGTRSSLMYETIRIVGQIRPKYVLWENVKNLLSKKHKHNFDAYIETMDILGYNSYYQVLNSKDYGIPQNRERVYTISIRKDIDNKQFKFPEKEELRIRLKDILEAEVDKKYYLSEKMQDYVLDFNNKQKGTAWEGRADEEKLNTDIAHAIGVRSAGGNQRAGVSNFIIDGLDEEIKVKDLKLRIKNATKKGYDEYERNKNKTNNGLRIRKLTPREVWRLMGFSDEDFEKAANIPTSNTQLYKQAGNSIVVNVLEKIFENLFLEDK